ncbi:MAG: hypothetical protein AUF79_14185 [Crenarchaeota archaeon 13_1_20CM_2_51_8]|nr:MAG: hypothetical protein AUF79_14185 [Crenarchaeota archaeon 13_1_20CM_2_51_8]
MRRKACETQVGPAGTGRNPRLPVFNEGDFRDSFSGLGLRKLFQKKWFQIPGFQKGGFRNLFQKVIFKA